MSFAKFLQALGFPTKAENGHELGCVCAECHAERARRDAEIRERIRAGAEPETLMEMLVADKRKRKREQQ